jgi:hypothetical protein
MSEQSPLLEMARVDNPQKDYVILGDCEIWIYGQDRSSMTPHFHYLRRRGKNPFELEIRLTDFTICFSKPRNGVSENKLFSWEGLSQERKALFEWLDSTSSELKTAKNKDILKLVWNQNNRDNTI